MVTLFLLLKQFQWNDSPLVIAYDYYKEAGLAIEIVKFAGSFNKLLN